ncbi:hypothetical protein [Cohnella abietis]|uniref:Uncharacterized protein n=1 Tax=Cohnella abietis TaxID=2507935 RepID=A0A3T1D2V9_9BACL|nr:hypothetical protein [Cohnella abietis]BBI32442.1 hypothetical protein KCTCHS21_18410 [Cohnella abietis]
MVNVREAQFRRRLDRGGQYFAEVEVFTDHHRDPQLLAYFRNGSKGSYSLVRLIANNADYEIDWFDNNLHSAFEDLTKPVSSSSDHMEADERNQFAAQILDFPGVSEALERNL